MSSRPAGAVRSAQRDRDTAASEVLAPTKSTLRPRARLAEAELYLQTLGTSLLDRVRVGNSIRRRWRPHGWGRLNSIRRLRGPHGWVAELYS